MFQWFQRFERPERFEPDHEEAYSSDTVVPDCPVLRVYEPREGHEDSRRNDMLCFDSFLSSLRLKVFLIAALPLCLVMVLLA